MDKIISKLQSTLEQSWSRPNALTWVLYPLSLTYGAVTGIRRQLYKAGFFARYKAPIPVIIVGNLTVGGTGKTPLVIYLVKQLQNAGFKPAVISRGYQSSAPHYPYLVSQDSPVAMSGDEPALIARRTDVPIMIGANRKDSIQRLLADFEIDVVISDDGLQHLELARDIEVCLTSPALEQCNTLLLPAGPYREPLARLGQNDFVVSTESSTAADAHLMTLQAEEPVSLTAGISDHFDASSGVHLVSGIGSPERFFATCESLGYRGPKHVFPDHHDYQAADIEFDDELPILMTEKDAVKCESFASSKHWALPVSVKLEPDLASAIIKRLTDLE